MFRIILALFLVGNALLQTEVCIFVLKYLIFTYKITYYVQTTLAALGEMFEAARGIMSWLGDCAKVCTQFLNSKVYITY